MGIRGDASAGASLIPLLKDRDPAVRREAAIALGKLDPAGSLPDLYAALGDSDTFRGMVDPPSDSPARTIWDKSQLISALSDDRRLDSALKLTDEAWSIPVVQALTEVLKRTASPAIRQRIVGNLSGLYQTYPDWTGEWFGTNPLAGPFPERNKDWDKSGMRAVLVGLATGLSDPDRAVRGQAIAGLGQAGQSSDAVFLLRTSLMKEADPDNQAGIAQILGAREDVTAAPMLMALLVDSARPERVRLAALGAMARFRDPQSLRGRLTLIYDPTAPEKLAAQALHDLATGGFLPTNDVASFFENASPAVRSAALLSLNIKKTLPDYLEQAVIDRLGDKTAEVRQAAIMAIGALKFARPFLRYLPWPTTRRQPNAIWRHRLFAKCPTHVRPRFICPPSRIRILSTVAPPSRPCSPSGTVSGRSSKTPRAAEQDRGRPRLRSSAFVPASNRFAIGLSSAHFPEQRLPCSSARPALISGRPMSARRARPFAGSLARLIN